MTKKGLNMFCFTSLLSLLFVFSFSSVSSANLLINEILADPPAGISGDANVDGVISSTQDEFIEFFNDSVMPLDISNWFVSDDVKMRHVFPLGTIINSHEYLVVFGGGSFTQTALKQKASTGTLSLNNTGDHIQLFDSTKALIDSVLYGDLANHNQSIVRNLENASGTFVLHSQLSFYNGKLFSPGYGMFQNSIQTSIIPVPETNSLMLLSLGLLSLPILRRKKFTKS